jgi:hypothetical protein
VRLFRVILSFPFGDNQPGYQYQNNEHNTDNNDSAIRSHTLLQWQYFLCRDDFSIRTESK